MITEDNELANQPKELWRYAHPETTQAWAFLQLINQKYDLQLKTYHDLFNWSVTNIADFWAEVWSFTHVVSSKPYTKVVDESAPIFPRPQFFTGARLSYAQNLLFPLSKINENSTAVISVTELSRQPVSWKDLRERVRKLTNAMRNVGVKRGDRIAGYVGNNVSTLVALLATSALGGIWSSTSSEIGVLSVVERLSQIEPVLIIADNASIYNQKVLDNIPKVSQIVKELPSIKYLIINKTSSDYAIDVESVKPVNGLSLRLDDFIQNADQSKPLVFEQLEFDYPLFIVYSSGTTGKPKCIVHGQGGSLIQHKKEHLIHMDMKPGEIFFQYTTCSWMMWQWQISGLASGATLVLYDGSPFQPIGDKSLFQIIDDLEVKYFGTSAKYLSVLEQKNFKPRDYYKLAKLSVITSTGSVLSPSTFEYVYKTFGSVLLGSITGGTDILSLFGAPSYLVPVFKGEVQVKGLGMAVQIFDHDGQNIEQTGEPGDLVCVKPFPCMPVKFWNDTDSVKYKASYFETFPGLWHHGDFVRLSVKTNGLIMLGRSDGVLKPAGVRFGSSEIYNVLAKEFADVIEDGLAVGMQRPKHNFDEIVVLFLKLQAGIKLDDELAANVKFKIRQDLSARHVPAIIDQAPELPYTANGKKTETIIKAIVSKNKVKIGASVANPECLDWYCKWADEH
ncbi:hypothetical protein V1514DRAFT_275834 [Lipomyces japonicus]|uniref:uncharacterized protein n=1 Tax=Lipomyces japonicus TaxID=56871 RepID=UPI0034CF555E